MGISDHFVDDRVKVSIGGRQHLLPFSSLFGLRDSRQEIRRLNETAGFDQSPHPSLTK